MAPEPQGAPEGQFEKIREELTSVQNYEPLKRKTRETWALVSHGNHNLK